MKACDLISHDKGLAIGHRRIVISTAGWVPGIIRFADEGHNYRLAISLNATTDRIRETLMPINRKYPMGELLNAAKYYTRKSRQRLTFEYVLIAGINDRPADGQRLRQLLAGIPCKVNLIPYNVIPGQFERPSETAIARFAESLYPLRAPVMVRWSKGDDIRAACGQLATADETTRRKARRKIIPP